MTKLESLIRAAFAKGFGFADDRQSAPEDVERAWQMHKDELTSAAVEPKADCPVCHSQLSNLLSGQPRCGNCGWLGSNTPQGG